MEEKLDPVKSSLSTRPNQTESHPAASRIVRWFHRCN